MSNLTNYFLWRTAGHFRDDAKPLLEVFPEISAPDSGYEMFNDGSVEIEIAEFLYSLVKLVKPLRILETGTHAGISSAYMAKACEENHKGSVLTLEYIDTWIQRTQQLHKYLELQDWVRVIKNDSRTFTLSSKEPIDLLFLDSEPNIRYEEFDHYWPIVAPGGFILIHDLHPNASYADEPNKDHPELGNYWPFGEPLSIVNKLKSEELQIISFDTPRGFVFMQKVNLLRHNFINLKIGKTPNA